ncbi:hypothetical protein T310_9617 [Rasamsonia emersonii CBS 393.64]|uniref:Uncharacterized protein n=1 Tax=Rasamsonia emersonii (strain ATCC 16479 / CBS 393.64 / IMI 116815) TaxID=1408163 RepID=A0A0F4YF00_RASE3|nr:hypothetical protein T310_9617 [Rasamsonia emersonii CBS 393.64]KKA16797.1 hypothetical protein T310_9617 [Rasamsonia emersonii CBS 393.64]
MLLTLASLLILHGRNMFTTTPAPTERRTVPTGGELIFWSGFEKTEDGVVIGMTNRFNSSRQSLTTDDSIIHTSVRHYGILCKVMLRKAPGKLAEYVYGVRTTMSSEPAGIMVKKTLFFMQITG